MEYPKIEAAPMNEHCDVANFIKSQVNDVTDPSVQDMINRGLQKLFDDTPSLEFDGPLDRKKIEAVRTNELYWPNQYGTQLPLEYD